MTPYPNLISESLLINETVALLRSFGGKASAVSVVDFVMKIRKPDQHLARLLVADLISGDPRLSLNGDIVEIITKSSGKPTRKWHDIAKTTLAKKMIRQALAAEKKTLK